MKYSKHIVFFLFINLVIVFLAIFLGNLTRKLEINNDLVEKNIQKEKEQLKVNKIEYSFYNNPNYLKNFNLKTLIKVRNISILSIFETPL